MECLNSNLSFTVCSLSIIPAWSWKHITHRLQCREETTALQTAWMERMVYPKQHWLTLVHAYYYAVQSIKIDHFGTFAFVFTSQYNEWCSYLVFKWMCLPNCLFAKAATTDCTFASICFLANMANLILNLTRIMARTVTVRLRIEHDKLSLSPKLSTV